MEQQPINNGGYVDAIAREARKPQIVEKDGTVTLAVPNGYTLTELDERIEALGLCPRRRKGTTHLDDAASFIDFVNRHKIPTIASIYCNANYVNGDVKLLAVLNDHDIEDASAGFRDFRASYAVPKSEEWKRWIGSNTKAMGQAEFATFVEDNLADIVTDDGLPGGAQMLEMALTMEVNQDARFKSAVRLQSGGVDLTYVAQEDDATLQKMRLFDRFALGIPVFLNGERYGVKARLRYRVKDGRCMFWYELIRADLVVQFATNKLIEQVHAGTELPVLLGRVD